MNSVWLQAKPAVVIGEAGDRDPHRRDLLGLVILKLLLLRLYSQQRFLLLLIDRGLLA